MFTLFAAEGDIVVDVKQNQFPDGTLHLNLPPYDVSCIRWDYESDAELFTLICLKKYYDQWSDSIALSLPYIPHARMDRVKNTEDVFTLKYFCEIINSLNFCEVAVFDAHSNVSLALLDKVYQVPIAEALQPVLSSVVYQIVGNIGHNGRIKAYEDLILFFPDEGAMKRYSSETELPYAFGMKKRNWETGKIEGLQVINGEMIKDKNVLIVDDICSRGGTFFHSARALKELGAKKIFLYVSHAEDTMVDGEMYNTPGLVDRIYTTNTIFHKEKDVRDKVEIVRI